MPYEQRMSRFAAFAQQVDMESSGKSRLLDGSRVRFDTGPVVWGEPAPKPSTRSHNFCTRAHRAGRVPDRAPGGKFPGRHPPQHACRVLYRRGGVGCVVYPATEITEPGVVRHVYGDKFSLGEPDGASSDRCRRLSEAIVAGGLRAPVLADIRSEIWLKLWGNLCFNPISALTRATLDRVATEPATRQLARAMMTEAESIATLLGVTLRVDMEPRIKGAAGVGPHRTSMLQDLNRGRVLEIDAQVTAVKELGQAVGAKTPVIDIVLVLVCQLAAQKGLYPVFPGSTSNSPVGIDRPEDLECPAGLA